MINNYFKKYLGNDYQIIIDYNNNTNFNTFDIKLLNEEENKIITNIEWKQWFLYLKWYNLISFKNIDDIMRLFLTFHRSNLIYYLNIHYIFRIYFDNNNINQIYINNY